MADELLSPEETAEVSPEDLAEQMTGETPKEGATPPAEKPAGEAAPKPPEGDEFEYEYVRPDGTAERLTPKQMADRLANYQKLQSEIGRLQNEKKAWQEKKAPETSQPAPTQSEGTMVDFGDLKNVDSEDPDQVWAVVQKLAAQNTQLLQQVQGLPTTIEKKATEIATQKAVEAEMYNVMARNEHLKKFDDPLLKEAVVKVSAALAQARNNLSEEELYRDLNTPVNVFFSLLQGKSAKPDTESHAGFVRALKAEGGEVAAVGGGKSMGDVVQRYANLKTQEEREKFIQTLSDEEVDLIDDAVYSGEVK